MAMGIPARIFATLLRISPVFILFGILLLVYDNSKKE